MAKLFSISGYFKDNKKEFDGYIVTDTNDIDEVTDEQIFFYGLSEDTIKEAIELGENTAFDFVITSYSETTL